MHINHSPAGRIRVLALIEANVLGGPSKNLLQFAAHARRAEDDLPPVDVTVVTYRRASQDQTPFAAAVQASGTPLLQIHENKRWDLSALTQLREMVDSVRPDILQTHNTKSHLFVRMLRLHRRYPWIAFNHGYTATNRMDVVYNQCDMLSLPGAARVVAVCQPFADRLAARRISRDRIRILHNSVKPFIPPAADAVEAARDRFGVRGKQVVICVGRLSAEKGHADLLHAFALTRRSEDVALLLAGDGPERPNLESLSRNLGLASSVVFAGHQSDVSVFYAMASLLALPSHTEGSPNVVLEALAAGVPTVATAVGGVPEIITDGENGLIVPPRQPEAMAAAIGRLLADDRLRASLSAAGPSHVAARHSLQAYSESLRRIYVELLAAESA